MGSVDVIKTVGQSSLMIGWERPPLDELGCSNGTFVYGYRVGTTEETELHRYTQSPYTLCTVETDACVCVCAFCVHVCVFSPLRFMSTGSSTSLL